MSVLAFIIVLLVVYLGSLKVVSYFAYKESKTTTIDYFLSGRDVGLLGLIGTTAASVFSTGTVVAAPSEFYSKGTGYMWIFLLSFCPVLIIFYGLKFWRLGKAKNFVTPSDLLADYYQSNKLRWLAGLVGLVCMIPYAAAQLVAVGKTFEVLTNYAISYEFGISIICIPMAIYLYYGGARAVIWTDMVQGFLLAILLVITGYLVVSWSGGWDELIGNAYEYKNENLVFKTDWHYYETFVNMISWFFLPYVWQRMYMAKNALSIARVAVVISLLFFILFFTTWIIGTSAITLLPDGLSDGDNVLGSIFNKYSPYFGAFVIVAVFAAGMSTIDSQMLSAGSIITYDFKRTLIKGKSENDYVIGRNFTLFLLVGIFIWSMFLKSAAIYSLILIGTTLSVIFIPAVTGALYWRRSTTSGAVWSFVTGILVYCAKEISPLGAYFPEHFGPVTYTLGTSTIVFVVVSLITSNARLKSKAVEYAAILK